MLHDNVHNSYLLLFGQYTEFIKFKLNIRSKWIIITDELYVLKFQVLIMAITLEFMYYRYMPLSINEFKINNSYRQQNLTKNSIYRDSKTWLTSKLYMEVT